MANITRKWRRWISVACSHGSLIDPNAAEAAINFKRAFKPERVIHLGDWSDMTALRGGAKGSADESAPIQCDIDSGLMFLEKLGVTDCLLGNHEARVYRNLSHPNAMVKELSEMLVNGIESRMRKLKINHLNKWSVFDYLPLYGYKFMHGTMYNQMAARDHAEAYGNCVFGHTHTTSDQRGRRIDNPRGICVGTLSGITNMDYALARRQTLAWSRGIAFGEGCGDEMGYAMLLDNGQSPTWRLPV